MKIDILEKIDIPGWISKIISKYINLMDISIGIYRYTRCPWPLRIMLRTSLNDLKRLHEQCCLKIKEVYEDMIVRKEAVNEGLRLMGLLSGVLRFTSDILGFTKEKDSVKKRLEKLNIHRERLDVNGLVGATLLYKNLGCKKFKWARKYLKRIIIERRELTPQLAEARLLLGEKSIEVINIISTYPCFMLFERSPHFNKELKGLSEYEKTIILLCHEIRKLLFTSALPTRGSR